MFQNKCPFYGTMKYYLTLPNGHAGCVSVWLQAVRWAAEWPLGGHVECVLDYVTCVWLQVWSDGATERPSGAGDGTGCGHRFQSGRSWPGHLRLKGSLHQGQHTQHAYTQINIKVSTLNMHMQIIIKVSRQRDWKEHVEYFVWNQPIFCSFAML